MLMGKSKSKSKREEEEEEEEEEEGGGKSMCGLDIFYVLPEGCIAAAISFTGPRDACRLATVSKVFMSASDSDAVWGHFLPSDYRELLARSDGVMDFNLLDSFSNKGLFFYLVDHPILLDNSTKSFFLDKSTGKKCFTICAKDLAITWGDTPRYWAFHPLPESRFPEVAELYSVCWLEIRGKIKSSMLSANTTYVAYLVFKMTETARGFSSPAQMIVKAQGSKSKTREVYLQDEEGRPPFLYRIVPRRMSVLNRIHRSSFSEVPPQVKKPKDKMLPRDRKDGWLEVEIGELTTRVGEDGEVEMSVLEVEGGNWKSGLIVEGIEIRPKVVLM